MKIIPITLKKKLDDSHKIYIGNDLEKEICGFLSKTKVGNKYAIISDSKVARLYAPTLKRELTKAGITSEIFFFKEGEQEKKLENLEKLANEMLAKNFDRKDAIIALGGGVVGDLGGFLASIYMRGIPFIQIPTTLLAMVDASVGGKTGVDLKMGKNLLGTFNQPKAVFIDTNYLKTLPQKQIRNGLAEIIKYGVIKDAKLFELIEKNLNKILKLDEELLNKIIIQSVEIKAEVVMADEKEAGERMILNYGHTYGHAIEKMSNYTLLHGYAISIGMVIANKMAVEKKLLSPKDAERIKTLIHKAGLPITIMKKPQMKDLMNDKKKIGGHINFILPTKIGKVIIHPEPCQQ